MDGLRMVVCEVLEIKCRGLSLGVTLDSEGLLRFDGYISFLRVGG